MEVALCTCDWQSMTSFLRSTAGDGRGSKLSAFVKKASKEDTVVQVSLVVQEVMHHTASIQESSFYRQDDEMFNTLTSSSDGL